MEYKKCFIPSCKNDSKNSPNKLIVRIREDSRKEWCRQANVQYFTVYNMYCCEDHFDPKEDLKNYYTFKSRKLRPIFKPTAKLRHISSDSQNQAPSPLPDCSELLKLLQDPSLTNNKRKHKDTSVPSTSTSDIIPNQSAAAQPGPSAEPCPETSRRDDQDNSDTNLPSRTDYPLNKRTIDQCRFCGDFTRDCFDLTTDNKPYIEKNKTSLTVNGLSVELDFNDDTLPKTVCHNCDGKLQEMLDFVTIVKAAQDTLINVADEREIETVIVKVEEPEDNDEDEESDDKAATDVSETQCVAKTAVFTHKRKSNKLGVQQKKRKVSHENINNSEFVYVKQEIETDDEIDKHGKPNVTNVKCENDELTIDIKEENIEIDSREALHSEIDTGVDVKPDEQELATHAFVYGMASKRS